MKNILLLAALVAFCGSAFAGDFNKPVIPSNASITGGTITNATITNGIINGTNISSGNHFVSGRVYSSLGESLGGTILMVANTTYCTPYYQIDPMAAVVSMAVRVTGAGTASNVKFGIATMSGTTATMITDLNPTGVATNTINTTVSGTFTAVNLKGHQFYLTCIIGAGTVMPTVAGAGNSNVVTWATGSSSTSFGSAVFNGWTSAANTYSTGFGATFALTPVAAENPFLGIVAP